MAQDVIDMAIQLHGGGGLSDDFPLAAAWTSARALRLADGPDEVHRGVIARIELASYLAGPGGEVSRVLVTGGASGLGAALVAQFVAEGHQVLSTDVGGGRRRDGGASYRQLDVRSPEDWEAAVAWCEQNWGGLDILVNNAGIATGGRIDVESLDEWDRVVDINLMGVVRGCRAFTPLFKRQRSGHIVNTASAAGLVHPPMMSSYNTVKAGVVALSETLSHELHPYGVTVSVVCPSFFRTNLADSIRGADTAMGATARQLIEKSPRRPTTSRPR